MTKKAVVIGAGIVGLAMARALAIRGFRVTVLERSERAVGASVRNFGMVWPIGQPTGKLLERAMRTRSIWISLCEQGKLWYDPCGSLLAVHEQDELDVIHEFTELNRAHRTCEVFDPERAISKCPALCRDKLLGALWSDSEVIVDPRQVLAALPIVLKELYDIQFYFGKCVSHVSHPRVFCGREVFEAEVIVVCSGYDFETLYPEAFASQPITRCKLQMLRTVPQPDSWRMGTACSAGLTLTHYAAFRDCASLAKLQERYKVSHPEYLQYGIHVMASQQGNGEITLGDSHEYGLTFEPFDSDHINQLILNYLDLFLKFPTRRIAQTWHGIYAKMTNGASELILEPESGVLIVNGLGGAGMTLSFGLAEEVVEQYLK